MQTAPRVLALLAGLTATHAAQGQPLTPAPITASGLVDADGGIDLSLDFDGDGTEMTAHAHHHEGHVHDRVDALAPIAAMVGHVHAPGELMLSYRYMYMDMDGNRNGRQQLSTADVLDEFPVSPTEMTMQMNMLGAMYAPTEWLTLMAMVPYIDKEMDHVTRMGVEFTTRSEGIGDIPVTAIVPLVQHGPHAGQASLGLSFPTGSIDERDATPADPTASKNLPYPMQLGSGTYDLLPGAAYTYQAESWSLGAAASGVVRLGRNSNDYALGDRLNATAWAAWVWQDWISTSMRLDYQLWGNIDGADPDLNPLLVPTADPNRQGGQRLDLLFGVNLYAPRGALAGNRLAIEIGFPIFQDLDGPQLETDLVLTVGWQYTF